MNPSRITDPVVRAMSADLNRTYRRMEAIEGRHASAIATLTDKEACHDEHELNPPAPHLFSAAGSHPASEPAAPRPFNAIVANAIETMRKPRVWL